MKIKILNYDELSRCAGSTTEFNIILHDSPHIIYYGLFNDENIVVSMMAVEFRKKSLKFRANYTPAQFRGNGYNQMLLNHLCILFKDYAISVEANNWSVKEYKNAGFTVKSVKKCRYWDKFYMHRQPLSTKKEQ